MSNPDAPQSAEGEAPCKQCRSEGVVLIYGYNGATKAVCGECMGTGHRALPSDSPDAPISENPQESDIPTRLYKKSAEAAAYKHSKGCVGVEYPELCDCGAEPQPKTDERKRILGDLRIFQAVFADLKMAHEIVAGRWVYTYEGIDPYELEDKAFPKTVEATRQLIRTERVSELEALKLEIESQAGNREAIGRPTDWWEIAESQIEYRIAELKGENR